MQPDTNTSPTSYSKSFMDEKLENLIQLPPEIEQGNVEYKLHLIDPAPERLEHLVTQLKWRLAEGHGEAMYEIGVSDKGELIGLPGSDLKASIETLRKMGKHLFAEISTVRERIVSQPDESPIRKVAEILIRKSIEDDQHFLEIRVAIIGGHDAGKSTLLGVLSQGELDNGCGKARLNLLRHPHEVESGRTSSISRQIIGFNPKGELINFATTNVSSWEQVCEVSSKVISFLDTCGHPKYQKTTISGLTGRTPDYACLIINANGAGISEVSREHLGIAAVLKVPIMIVVTKIDIATSEQLTKTLKALFQLLKSPGLKKMPVIMENTDDVVVSVSNFVSLSSIVPVFLTSCVTGENVNLLTQFLNLLSKPMQDHDSLLLEDPEYQIEEIYSVPDVGTVVGGVLLAGQLRLMNQCKRKVYYVGPSYGLFVPCRITSIHRQRCPVATIKAGQAATCAIELIQNSNDNQDEECDDSNLVEKSEDRGIAITKNQLQNNRTETYSTSSESDSSLKLKEPLFKFRKGQVILNSTPPFSSSNVSAKATWEFDAEIHVLYHRGCLTNMSQASLYFGSARQSARIVHVYQVFASGKEINSKELRTGEKGKVRLRFMNEPEWIRVGWTVLFREGRTKCVGKVCGFGPTFSSISSSNNGL